MLVEEGLEKYMKSIRPLYTEPMFENKNCEPTARTLYTVNTHRVI